MARPIPLPAPVITATRPATDRSPRVNLVMGRDHTAGVLLSQADPAAVDLDLGAIAQATLGASLAAVPLGISLWALLDAARRPRWAWALAGRRQVVWMAVIMFGVLTVVGGLLISGYYLARVRPAIAAVERGEV